MRNVSQPAPCLHLRLILGQIMFSSQPASSRLPAVLLQAVGRMCHRIKGPSKRSCRNSCERLASLTTAGRDRRLFWCGRSKKRSIDGCGRRLSAVELRAMRWHHGRRCAGQYGAASPDHPKGSPTPAEPSAEAGRFPCVIGQIPSGLQNCRQRHTVHGRQPVRLQWRHGSRSAMQEQARSATAPGHDGTTTKSSTSKRRAGSRPSTLDTQHRHSTPTLANTHVDTKWLKCDLDTYHIWSTDTDPTLSRRSSNRRAGTGLGLSQAPTVPPKSGVWAQNPPTPSQAPLRSNAA